MELMYGKAFLEATGGRRQLDTACKRDVGPEATPTIDRW